MSMPGSTTPAPPPQGATSPKPHPDGQEFQALDLAFLGSLLPGIIHNFATPLSGVLGATQLLEKRASTLEELVRGGLKLGVMEREELQKQFERTRTNVDILSRNAKHLADLLQILVQRINRCSITTQEYFALNDIVQSELRFLEAHLTFKHKVRKQVTLSEKVATIPLVYGHVAATIEEFVVNTLPLHDLSKGSMEMDFCTAENDGMVSLRIAARFVPNDQAASREPLTSYMIRLRQEDWSVDLTTGTGERTLHLARRASDHPA